MQPIAPYAKTATISIKETVFQPVPTPPSPKLSLVKIAPSTAPPAWIQLISAPAVPTSLSSPMALASAPVLPQTCM